MLSVLMGKTPGARKITPIAWSNITHPKWEGGLGFKNLKPWNQAMLGKHLWDIQAKKDTLWIQWINHLFMKGKTMWDCVPKIYNSWYWRQLTKIWSKIQHVFDRNTGKWLGPGDRYTVAEGYEILRYHNSEVEWHTLVWNKWKVPKCSFIAWLAMQNRLLTRDRLNAMGITNDVVCLLCNVENETTAHLFFECTYSHFVMINCAMELLQVQQWPEDWREWITTQGQPGIYKQRFKLLVTIVIYNIWLERNKRYHAQCNTQLIPN